ncbi:hypothetical protein L7F22_046618 [Adiantum nelumboides]|nr:hypothetical protein [Adiantum nelumboides]
MTTLRCVLALVAKVDMELVQMDVKTTFLHGDLHEDIYMQHLEGFVVVVKEHLSEIDHCLYTKQAKDVSLLILILYVNDMLLVKKNIDELAALQSKLNDNFDMKNLGDANHILDMQNVQDRDRWLLYLSQTEYINKVLKHFNMEGGKALSTPLSPYVKLLTKC